MYTIDSSICRAAIHAGVNQDIGGLIEYTIKEGLMIYEQSSNRQIASLSHGDWPLSFSINKPVASHIKLAVAFQSSTPLPTILALPSKMAFPYPLPLSFLSTYESI